jgi:carbon-monoxide dehydrogenase iron sulfur subunit
MSSNFKKGNPMEKIPVINQRMVMLIDFDTCSGCQSCVIACSMVKAGVFSTSKSLITIRKLEGRCLSIPIICEHCDDPPCLHACPTGAIAKDPETGVVKVDQDLCTGCGLCSSACPFGPETVKFQGGKAVLCDLCGGEPACARICQQKAIAYMPLTVSGLSKKRELAEKRKLLLQPKEVA